MKITRNNDVAIIAPNKCDVTISGCSLRLTVRYPNIPCPIITKSKVADSTFNLFSLNAINNSAIAKSPSEAANHLCTTSGIILSISTGESGYRFSAIAISSGVVGNVTNP